MRARADSQTKRLMEIVAKKKAAKAAAEAQQKSR
jgi:hypothetical protein